MTCNVLSLDEKGQNCRVMPNSGPEKRHYTSAAGFLNPRNAPAHVQWLFSIGEMLLLSAAGFLNWRNLPAVLQRHFSGLRNAPAHVRRLFSKILNAITCVQEQKTFTRASPNTGEME